MDGNAQKTTGKDSGTAGLPAHEMIYRKLREQILFGEIAPGQPVTIQGLTERLNAGMTPVREAIRRLTSEGALEFQGNRRVIVPLLTADNLAEITFARQWLEAELGQRATIRATPADLADLTQLDQVLDHAISQGDLPAYLEFNYRFHARIYDLAEAPILAAMAEGLWLRFGPSLRVVCGRVGTQNLPDRHKELLACMKKGDAEGAAHACREDMLQGMEQVRDMLAPNGRPD
ncbi:GntR family transcriptional regulator [Thalassovita sp.]|uniref:GntR family transcriptional regulator n=1 Tax=Thalassovita sp. TaxID=1979401 RepID=UPI0029DE666F|nr:GntR family transcriptional regulator [Thalassovita sp.]